jgi:hypothetical protein
VVLGPVSIQRWCRLLIHFGCQSGAIPSSEPLLTRLIGVRRHGHGRILHSGRFVTDLSTFSSDLGQ